MKTIASFSFLLLSLAACERKQESAVATHAATATATAPAAPSAAPVAAPVAAAAAPANGAEPAKIAVGTKMKCPVTGEDFTVKESTVQVTYQGKRYAFCCEDCQPRFEKDPAKFAKN